MNPLENVTVTADTEAERPPAAVDSEAKPAELVLDDLLVEDVSIDGMCGVY
jgi:mycofactocin precursor